MTAPTAVNDTCTKSNGVGGVMTPPYSRYAPIVGEGLDPPSIYRERNSQGGKKATAILLPSLQ